MMIHLSEKQREIVNFDNGPLLVKAGPGSGKTRVLIERVKRLINTKKRTRVLALTFSNMAADEMRSRIQQDLTSNNLMDNVSCSTIHSFCLEIVQTRGHLIGLPHNLTLFENADDRKTILKDAIAQDPRLKKVLEERDNSSSFLTDCINIIAGYKRAFILPEDSELSDVNARIYAKYNEALLIQGAIDFDDILFYAYRILTENPNIPKLLTTQYHYICIDEAQDLNYAQYQVIRAICSDSFKNIMLVGDEKQSIYGFNGSDSRLMSEQFVLDFQPTVFELNENFRSAKTIVAYANTLEEASDYPNCYYNGELKFSSFNTEKEEAQFVCNKIEFLMQNGHPDVEGDILLSDIAVIARNRYLFSQIEKTLSESGIPYYFRRSVVGIESESIAYKLFDLGLRLLTNPRDIIHRRERERILQLAQEDSLSVFIDECLRKIDVDKLNLPPVLQEIEEWTINSILNDEEKYLIINDGKTWRQHWNKYASQVQRENRTVASFRNYIALGKTQIEEGKDGITLLTAHMSKGLQFEVVFIIGLSEGTFPDYRAVQSEGKAMDQEKNNMFVAVTRAKRLCYLSNAQNKTMPWGGTKRQIVSRFVKPLLE